MSALFSLEKFFKSKAERLAALSTLPTIPTRNLTRYWRTFSEMDKEKTMNKDRVTMTIEIDREVYNHAAELFKKLGTTIEDMRHLFLSAAKPSFGNVSRAG